MVVYGEFVSVFLFKIVENKLTTFSYFLLLLVIAAGLCALVLGKNYTPLFKGTV